MNSQKSTSYTNMYKTAVRVSKRSRVEAFKHDDGKESSSAKRGRMSNKTFMINAIRKCPVCKVKQHMLFRCDKFKELSVPKRVEAVKNAKLCFNCLRSHLGKPCTYTTCTICQKRHNTLLHFDKHTSATTTKADATDTKIEKAA